MREINQSELKTKRPFCKDGRIELWGTIVCQRQDKFCEPITCSECLCARHESVVAILYVYLFQTPVQNRTRNNIDIVTLPYRFSSPNDSITPSAPHTHTHTHTHTHVHISCAGFHPEIHIIQVQAINLYICPYKTFVNSFTFY